VLEIVVRQGMAGLEAEGGVVALLGPRAVITPAITVGYPKETVAAFAPLTVDRSLPLTDAVRERKDRVRARTRLVRRPLDGGEQYQRVTRNRCHRVTSPSVARMTRSSSAHRRKRHAVSA
jgi:hypothetical protein